MRHIRGLPILSPRPLRYCHPPTSIPIPIRSARYDGSIILVRLDRKSSQQCPTLLDRHRRPSKAVAAALSINERPRLLRRRLRQAQAAAEAPPPPPPSLPMPPMQCACKCVRWILPAVEVGFKLLGKTNHRINTSSSRTTSPHPPCTKRPLRPFVRDGDSGRERRQVWHR